MNGAVFRPVWTVATALLLLAGCSSKPDPEYAHAVPDEPPIPLSAPVGGSTRDFDVDRFDTCSPFASQLWVTTAAADRESRTTPEPGGGCRWQGPGMTATVAVDSGRTLAEYSNDPRFRPGGTGSSGNRYWETATSDATRECHVFLAAGPARPDRVVHMFVQTEGPQASAANGGEMHACVFAEALTSASSLILENPSSAATPVPG